MQERHRDNALYFSEQGKTTSRYVIPYISEFKKIGTGCSVLEIGCGEGGNLEPFLDAGCLVTGVDISESRIVKARDYFKNHPANERLTLICDDIYNRSEKDGQFDVIIMRDVIEHIHNQEKFMAFVKRFLKKGGVFFLAFPPWYMPFGGHQQICRNKWLSKIPYYHLLPSFLYSGILKLGGENKKTIDDLLEIKQTGISLERFERITRRESFRILQRTLYFINPNYEVKFGLKPRVQNRFIGAIPFLRNFVVTAGYYLLAMDENSR